MRGPLNAKLSPPSASPTQVPRQRVTDLVCEQRTARLVLVRAPAGFGKTTAMLQSRARLEEIGVRTAWLTLDRADNDVSRFLYCLDAALGDLVPDVPDEAGADDAAFHLVSRLARCDTPFSLFVDEFEVIQEPGVTGLMREMIEHLPPRGQVVIGTRSLPDLGLGRLRARGQLLEIDADLLRFSARETQEFLSARRGIELPAVDLRLLHRKTEGWIAGLWLASAALARHEAKADFIARFSGSNRAVADYLTEDVLNLQPPEIRDFLLRTSILKQLMPALCRALVPGVDSEALLRRLDAENVLVTPIEGDEPSYRYHSLFASFLQAQLAREAAQEVPMLHRAAAHWFRDHRRPVPAIEHAIEGGDIPLAIELLNAHAMSLLAAGRLRLLSRWFDTLPEAELGRHPKLQAIHLWAIGFTRGPWEALARLERSGLERSSAPEVRPHVMAMRPVLLATMDRTEEGFALGMERLGSLPTGDAFADAALLTTLAAVSSSKGMTTEALGLLDLRRRSLGPRATAMSDMHAESIEGTIALFEGRLREATTHFRIAVSTTHVADSRLTGGNAWAGILYAAAVYESGDLEAATNLLRVYVPLARDVGIPDHVTLGYRMLARIAFGAGDVDQAFRMLAELESLGYQFQLPRVVASARLERSRIQLLQGHAEASRDELERASDPAIWTPISHLRLLSSDLEYPMLARLRWEMLAGNAAEALEGLDRELATAIAERRHHRALKLRLLRTVALAGCGDRPGALAGLQEALEFCHREGFLRIVVDEGPALGALVQQLAMRQPPAAAAAHEPAFASWLQRLPGAFGATLPEPEPEQGGAQGPGTAGPGLALAEYLLDPLTQKELRILRLLAEGYSNAAMAEKLFVSDSTVRTHLRNINSKLGVRSRMQAVSAARRLALLR